MVCQTTGSVRLYTDLSKTTLVDAFSFANAPTTHRIGSGDFVIQGDVSGPGVDVVVVVAGTPHVLGFRLVSKSTASNPGGIGTQRWSMTVCRTAKVISCCRATSVKERT